MVRVGTRIGVPSDRTPKQQVPSVQTIDHIPLFLYYPKMNSFRQLNEHQ